VAGDTVSTFILRRLRAWGVPRGPRTRLTIMAESSRVAEVLATKRLARHRADARVLAWR